MSLAAGVGLALCSCTCSAVGYTLQKIAHLRADAEAAGRKSETEHLSTLPVASYGTADKLQAAGAGRSQVENASKTTSPLLDDPGLVEIAVASVHQPESDAQKHESEVGEAPSKPQQQKSYMKYWQFQVGLALMAIGAVAAAFVFGLAPQSTLAPLGSVTMILNTFLSWRFLGEAFTHADAASVMLMAVGTTVAVLFGKGQDPKYTLDAVVDLFVERPAAWGLALTTAVAIAAGTVFVGTIGRPPADKLSPKLRAADVILRAFLGAAWSGYSNYASKAVVEVAFSSVSDRSGEDWLEPELYLLALVMVVSLVMQVKYLNAGLAKYDAMVVVRLYQAMYALFSVLSGFFYFNEVASQSDTAIAMFLLGVGIVTGGIMAGMLRRPDAEKGDHSQLPLHCRCCRRVGARDQDPPSSY